MRRGPGGQGLRLHPQQIFAFGKPCEALDAKETLEGGKAVAPEHGVLSGALDGGMRARARCTEDAYRSQLEAERPAVCHSTVAASTRVCVAL